MFKSGDYRNTLDNELLGGITDEDSGQPLAELIELDDKINSRGKSVNQAFRNLVDAEILFQHGVVGDYTIGFKYERFYDYFGGKILSEYAKNAPDLIAGYQLPAERCSSNTLYLGASIPGTAA